jgi:hypothetical protein
MIASLPREPMWVIAALTRSVDSHDLSITTGVEVYAVAPTLQAAEDILHALGPYIDRDTLVQILEAPLVKP